METISIQIPASLYTAIFQRFGDRTTDTITARLSGLLDGDEVTSRSFHDPAPAYSRPRKGTITGRVWEIADQIQKHSGRAEREGVIKACMEEGININTASTQFSYWRKANP